MLGKWLHLTEAILQAFQNENTSIDELGPSSVNYLFVSSGVCELLPDVFKQYNIDEQLTSN